MRKLFLLSGCSASGKSTFIEKNNLKEYTISLDDLRLLYKNPIYTEQSKLGISQKNNKLVSKLVKELLEHRFNSGSTVILDSTNIKKSYFKDHIKLAKKYNYRVYFVKFGTNLTVDDLVERDMKREQYKQVGRTVIERQFNELSSLEIPSGVTKLTPEQFLEELNWKIREVNKYSKIKVIGDIHSCATVLKEAVKDFNPDTLYVFLGDYFDRGTKPVETFKILQDLSKKSNCVFLTGNHEKHIYDYLSGNKIKSREFRENTLPALLKAGIKDKDLKNFVKCLQPVYITKYGIFNLLFSHAGFTSEQIGTLSQFTNRLALLEEEEFLFGIGGYSIDLEAEVSKYFTNIIQFHGHRNPKQYKTDEFGHAFIYNLEQSVEKGGKLGIVDLVLKGKEYLEISDNSIDNSDFKEDRLVDELRKHPKLIKEKKLNDSVSVFNFTPKVFYDKLWTRLTTQARGLYLNTDTDNIVCRGYTKFFNINERPESSINYIQENIINKGHKLFLVSEKENVFLGLVSYIPEINKDDLSVFSKGAGEDFSKLAKETILEYFKDNNIDYNLFKEKIINDYNNNDKYTLTFEIVNIDSDPHIVNYSNNTVFLLDCIKNSVVEQVDYIKREEFVREFGIQVAKSKIITINNFSEFYADEIKRTDTEGVVIQNIDTNDRWKIKTLYYNKKKELRTILEALIDKPIKEQIFILEQKMKNKNFRYLKKDSVSQLFNLLSEYDRENLDFSVIKTVRGNVDVNKNILEFNIKF